MKRLNIEIIVNKYESLSCLDVIIPPTQLYLQKLKPTVNSVLSEFDRTLYPILPLDVKTIIVEDNSEWPQPIDFYSNEINWQVYNLDNHGPMAQVEESDESSFDVATQLTLPSASIYNLWENLYYEGNIKQELLQYAETMMKYSDHRIDPNIISCNRVILLHGPPGTGKTSLCKALAQKLSIRMQNRFSSGLLVEINSHSLFSKWFSESGKLVTKMFTKIVEVVENPNILVCVLIDEIESLAHARNQCVSGVEPSDSIRVVNAVLTQIDRIKSYSNVLILTTSNITGTIDLAFIDRADIKQYLGPPTAFAIYKIYYSCIEELIKNKLMCNTHMVETPHAAFHEGECIDNHTKQLKSICEKSLGLSGRSLRKVPFLAQALFLDTGIMNLSPFLEAMLKAVNRVKMEKEKFEN